MHAKKAGIIMLSGIMYKPHYTSMSISVIAKKYKVNHFEMICLLFGGFSIIFE